MPEERRLKFDIQGDQIYQEISGSGPVIGKQVTGPSGPPPALAEAIAELHRLSQHLVDLELIAENGDIPDEDALNDEIIDRQGMISRLVAAVRSGAGPSLHAAVGGTIAGAVLKAVTSL